MIKNIVPNNVEFISGLSQHSIEKALNNISGHIHFAKQQADTRNEKFYIDELDKMEVFSGETRNTLKIIKMNWDTWEFYNLKQTIFGQIVIMNF